LSTVIQVKDLSPNQTYYFAVTAYNTGKVESDRSNEVTYKVPASAITVVARSHSVSVQEDSSLPMTLTADCSDPSAVASQIVYTITSGPTQGTLSGTPPNLTYFPKSNYNGTDSFQFCVAYTGSHASSPATVDIQVSPVNDAPIATQGSLSVIAGSSIPVVLAGTDIDGDPLSFVITKAPSGGTLSGSGANRIYAARSDFSGTDSIEYTATDGKATSAAARITIEVKAPANQAPTAIAQSKSVDEDGTLALMLTGSDPENQPLSFKVSVPPKNGTLTGVPPSVTYRPNANFNGPDSFEFTASDGTATSAAAKISILVAAVNDPPSLAESSVNLNEDSQASFTLVVSDPDSSTFTYTVTQPPAKGTLSGTAPNLSYAPNANYNGDDSMVVSVSDGSASSAPATIRFIVAPSNDTPVALAQNLSVNAGSSLTVNLGATDVENDPLTFTITKAPSSGTLTGSGASRTYAPSSGFAGTDTIEFTANDGRATSAPARITIEVKAFANKAPTAIAQSKSINEDTTLALTLAATDPENQTLTYAISAQPKNGTLTGVPPSITYRPNPNYYGTDAFEFTANDGTATSAAAKVAITIASVNDAPVAESASTEVNEDNSILIELKGSDVEGSALTYTISAQPLKGRLMGTAPLIRYVPGNNFNGVDTFKFTVKDGSLTSAPATITVNVTPVNDTPIATTRSYSLSEDRTYAFTLGGTDVDGDSLSFEIVEAPSQGKISGTIPNLVYTPNTNWFGSDTLQFTVRDAGVTSLPAKINFSVVSVNDIPVAQSASVSLTEDNPVSFAIEGSDVETSSLTYIIRSNPLNGVLSGTAPNLTYTPKANFNGVDSFTFSVSDGTAGSTYAKVTLNVSAVNDAPVAQAKSVSTAYGTAVAVALTGTDVEKSALTYKITRSPGRGALTGTAPNLTYKPSTGFYGTDTFEYSVSDGSLTSSPATVTVSVKAPAGVLSIQPDSAIVGAFGTTSTLLNGATSVTDNDGIEGISQVSLVQAPRQGTVSLSPDGKFTYRHTGGSDSEDTFTYSTTVDGATSEPVTVAVSIFRLSSLSREGNQIVMAFPAIPGVLYRIQGNADSASDSANWQSLGEVTTQEGSILEVPTEAPADEANRYFRIAAITPANATVLTETFGFQRRSLQAGTQTVSGSFQGTLACRTAIESATGNTVTIGTSSLATGSWNPRNGMATHALVASGKSLWWPILGSDGNQLTLDTHGSDLARSLEAGQSVEIVRLSTALDLFGNPETGDSTLQAGDFVDFVNGNGTVCTLECLGSPEGNITYRLRENGTDLGGFQASDVTFLDGQPIQIQKTESAGTIWFLGRVQGIPLAPYRAGSSTGTSGTLVE